MTLNNDYEQLHQPINENTVEPEFGKITEERLKNIYEEFQTRVSDEELHEKICLICNRLIINTKIKRYIIEQLPLLKMFETIYWSMY